MSDVWSQHLRNRVQTKFRNQKLENWHFSKTNVISEISTFEIGYMRNFTKIRKLILFDSKCPNLGIWVRNFRKTMSDLKSAPSKQKNRQNFVKRLEIWHFFAKNTQIWAFGLKAWKTKASRKFQISTILKFRVVSAGFASFLVLVSTQ